MEIVLLFVLAVWIYRYIEALMLPEKGELSAPGLKKPLEREPFVSVVLSARNEEDAIEQCLSRLARQSYRNYEIIVADDRSTDATLRIVQEKFPGVTLVKITSLPAGCAGKSHAISVAVRRARGDWLLFTDADTEHSRDSILAPLSYALREDIDMLSLLPRPLCAGFWEKVLQPVESLLLFMLFPLERINSEESAVAFGCGQYILIRRDAYNRLGGHDALKAFPLEDVEMARRAKKEKLNARLIFGGNTFRTRMYRSLGELWNGWTRIYYLLFCDRIWVLPAVVLLIFLLSILPYIALFFFPLLALSQLLFLHLATERAYRYLGADRRYIIAHPLACLLTAAILAGAFWRRITGRGVLWRGERYHEWTAVRR